MTKSVLSHGDVVRVAIWVDRNRELCETAPYQTLADRARAELDMPGLTLNNVRGALKAASVERRSRAGGDAPPDLRPVITALARALRYGPAPAMLTAADRELLTAAGNGDF